MPPPPEPSERWRPSQLYGLPVDEINELRRMTSLQGSQGSCNIDFSQPPPAMWFHPRAALNLSTSKGIFSKHPKTDDQHQEVCFFPCHRSWVLGWDPFCMQRPMAGENTNYLLSDSPRLHHQKKRPEKHACPMYAKNLQGTKISPFKSFKVAGNMMFLLYRWDVLASRSVYIMSNDVTVDPPSVHWDDPNPRWKGPQASMAVQMPTAALTNSSAV